MQPFLKCLKKKDRFIKIILKEKKLDLIEIKM
jgi:hypothetical protein